MLELLSAHTISRCEKGKTVKTAKAIRRSKPLY